MLVGSGELNSDKHMATIEASIFLTPTNMASGAAAKEAIMERTREDLGVERVRDFKHAKCLLPDLSHLLATVVDGSTDAPVQPRSVGELRESDESLRHLGARQTRRGQGCKCREVRRGCQLQVHGQQGRGRGTMGRTFAESSRVALSNSAATFLLADGTSSTSENTRYTMPRQLGMRREGGRPRVAHLDESHVRLLSRSSDSPRPDMPVSFAEVVLDAVPEQDLRRTRG